MKKICKKCYTPKSIDEFKEQKGGKYGVHAWCRLCTAEKDKLWRSKNKDHIKVYKKIRRKTHPETVKKSKAARKRDLIRAKRESFNLEDCYIKRLICKDKLLTHYDLVEASKLIDLYRKKLILKRKIYANN